MNLLRIFFTLILLISSVAFADEEMQVIRRLAVFPVKAAGVKPSVTEACWWKMRELLTKDRRLLIATKRFMIKKEVLQARSRLSPADAIILGKILDAQTLIVTFIDEKNIRMIAYDTSYGLTLWEQGLQLHPVVPIEEQLEKGVEKLIFDLVGSFPYQGYVVNDALQGKPVYIDQGIKKVQVEVGPNTQIEEGDLVQWIRVYGTLMGPVFQAGGRIEVIAEGKVLDVQSDKVVVELERAKEIHLITEGMAVRFPKEAKRIGEAYIISQQAQKIDVVSTELKTVQNKEKVKALPMALAFVFNIAAFILLAF